MRYHNICCHCDFYPVGQYYTEKELDDNISEQKEDSHQYKNIYETLEDGITEIIRMWARSEDNIGDKSVIKNIKECLDLYYKYRTDEKRGE